MENVRRVRPEETVILGDLVTVNDTPESGYRPLSGHVGIPASDYSYPIYRNMDIDKEYIQFKDGETGPILTVGGEEAKRIIDSMLENEADGNPQEYTLSTKTMTEEQFKSLPKFTGF